MKHATSRRSVRLSEEIMRELANLLTEEVQDPRLELVTVSGVRLNADISVAEVYVTYSVELHAREDVDKALEKAKGFLRTKLGKRLKLRKTPELRFRFDDFLENMVYERPE